MTALLIDTSSAYSLVGISEGKSLLYTDISSHGNNLSRYLLPSIQDAITKTSASLEYIAVGMGPGSYTGTRVGATVAKTLSFALNIPIAPFCSLLSFLPDREGLFGCLMPAKSGNCYLLKGRLAEGALSVTFSSLLTPEETLAQCRECDYLAVQDSAALPLIIRDSSIELLDWHPNLKNPLLFAHSRFLEGLDTNACEAEMIYLHVPSKR